MHANLLHMSNSCELHENVGMHVTYVNAVISSGEIGILAQTSSILLCEWIYENRPYRHKK